jgi:hypothetical protein
MGPELLRASLNKLQIKAQTRRVHAGMHFTAVKMQEEISSTVLTAETNTMGI